MNTLTDYSKLVEDRKAWNRTIANFDDSVEKCPSCGGPMEQGVLNLPDPVGTIYESVCKNPDCPEKQ